MINTGLFTQSLAGADPASARFHIDNSIAGPLSSRPLCRRISIEDLMGPIRSSAKAIVIRGGRLLTIRHLDEQGEWFSLPGGGQRPGETLVGALGRESIEELGFQLEVGQLRFVREYIGKNHEFAAQDFDAHKVDHFFECKLSTDTTDAAPVDPDPGQLGVAWLPMADLHEFRLYPQVLKGLLLRTRPSSDEQVYLGDVN